MNKPTIIIFIYLILIFDIFNNIKKFKRHLY